MSAGNFAVLFDFDGTLFQTALVDRVAVNRARGRFAMPPLASSFIDEMIGLPTSRFVAIAADAQTAPPDFEDVFTQEELAAVALYGALYPGVYEMLCSVRNTGATMAICSNGGREYLSGACAHTQIHSLFDEILPEEIGSTKSEMTMRLLRRLRADCGVFVGDRTQDLIAARDNGLTSIGVTWGYGKREPESADVVVHTAEELERVLLQFIKQNQNGG